VNPAGKRDLALLFDDEKSTLHVTSQNAVPHNHRAAHAERVPELDALSGGKRGVRMRRAEPAVTGIEQTALESDRSGAFQHEPHIAPRLLAALDAFLGSTGLLAHATELSSISPEPYIFNLRLSVRVEIPSSFAAVRLALAPQARSLPAEIAALLSSHDPIGIALLEAGSGWTVERAGTRLVRGRDGLEIRGEKVAIEQLQAAGQLVVVATLDGAPALAITPAGAAGLTRQRQLCFDETVPMETARFDAVQPFPVLRHPGGLGSSASPAIFDLIVV